MNLKSIHILYRILGNSRSLLKPSIGSFRERGNGRSVVSVKLTEIADCLLNGWTDLHLSISLALIANI